VNKKRAITKKNTLTSPWHKHGERDVPIQNLENEIVEAYKAELERLNDMLVTFYQQNQADGLVTYAKIARNGKLDMLLDHIRETVDNAFKARARVIFQGLRAAEDAAYTDILYQAERLAYAKAAALNKTNILPMEARLRPAESYGTSYNSERFDAFWREGADGLPAPSGELRQAASNSEASLVARIKAAAAGRGTGLAAWQAILADELSKDAGRCLRVVYTQANRAINSAVHAAFRSDYADRLLESMRAQGAEFCERWVHDEPKRPRSWHIAQLHGTVPDLDGYWWSTGTGRPLSAAYPGGFGEPEEDCYCRCYLGVCDPREARGMSTPRGIVPVPGNYLEEKRKRAEAGA